MKKDVHTLEDCLEVVDKFHKKLGESAYLMIRSAISDNIISRDSYWSVDTVTTSNRPVYRCSVCGKVSAAPVKYCPGCGTCKVDASGNIKKK